LTQLLNRQMPCNTERESERKPHRDKRRATSALLPSGSGAPCQCFNFVTFLLLITLDRQYHLSISGTLNP
jgi:hypothetical protein